MRRMPAACDLPLSRRRRGGMKGKARIIPALRVKHFPPGRTPNHSPLEGVVEKVPERVKATPLKGKPHKNQPPLPPLVRGLFHRAFPSGSPTPQGGEWETIIDISTCAAPLQTSRRIPAHANPRPYTTGQNPPSMFTAVPVMKDAASDARKHAMLAYSSAVPIRPSGMSRPASATYSSKEIPGSSRS